MADIREVAPSVLASEIIEALHEGLYEQGEFFEEYGIDAEANSAHEFLTQVLTILQRAEHCHADSDGDCEWEGCPQKQKRETYCRLAAGDSGAEESKKKGGTR